MVKGPNKQLTKAKIKTAKVNYIIFVKITQNKRKGKPPKIVAKICNLLMAAADKQSTDSD